MGEERRTGIGDEREPRPLQKKSSLFHRITAQSSENGPEKDQQRAARPGSRSPSPVQRRSRRGRPISLAGNHHGAARIAVPGRRLFPHHSLSHGLPLHTAEGGVHDAHIPPEHKLKRLDLPRHTEVAVVTGADHIEGVALNLLAPLRPQPRRPPRPGDRQDFQNRQGEVLRVGAGVDQKIRNVNLAPSRPSLTRATYAQHPYPTISSISKIMRTIESKSRDIKTHQFDVQRPHTHSFFSENSPNLIIDAKR